MNKVKVFLIPMLVIVVLVTMVILPGCKKTTTETTSVASTTSEITTAVETTGTTVAATTKVEGSIDYWTYYALPQEEGKKDAVIESFENEHPGATVNLNLQAEYGTYLDSLKISVPGGNAGDVVLMEVGAQSRQYADFLLPMEDLANNQWGQDWQEKIFIKTALDQAYLTDPKGEHLLMLPGTMHIGGYVWYNRDIFKKYNLEIPSTYAELLEIAKTLKNNGIIPMVFGGKDDWQYADLYIVLAEQAKPGLLQKAEAGEASWTSPELVKALTLMVKMFKEDSIFQEGVLGATAYPEAFTLFWSGKAAMVISGSWNAGARASAFPDASPEWDEQWGIFQVPPLEPGLDKGSYFAGVAAAFGITKYSKNPTLAWEFIQWFVTKGMKIMVDLGYGYPTVKTYEVAPRETPIAQQNQERFLNDMVNSQTVRREFIYPDLKMALINALKACVAGEANPEDAMVKVEEVSKTIKR